MNKATKTWLIVASSLIFAGIIFFTVAMSLINWDFRKLSTTKYQTTTHEIIDEFTNISINIDTADIEFFTTNESKTIAVSTEYENAIHTVTVVENTLKIEISDTRKWYEHITLFSFVTPKISIYLPCEEYQKLSIISNTGDIKIPNKFKFSSIDITNDTGDVVNYASASDYIKINTSTGDVKIEKVTTKEISVCVSTGDVRVIDVNCSSLVSSGNTGDVTLKNVIATENFLLERSTGDVEFERCDASKIYIKTSTGDVDGSLLSEKIFVTKSSTGDIDIPRTSSGGICDIITSTGDIEVDLIP